MSATPQQANTNHFSCWRSTPCDRRTRTTRDAAAPATAATMQDQTDREGGRDGSAVDAEGVDAVGVEVVVGGAETDSPRDTPTKPGGRDPRDPSPARPEQPAAREQRRDDRPRRRPSPAQAHETIQVASVASPTGARRRQGSRSPPRAPRRRRRRRTRGTPSRCGSRVDVPGRARPTVARFSASSPNSTMSTAACRARSRAATPDDHQHRRSAARASSRAASSQRLLSAQPQRDVGGLHGVAYDGAQVGADGVEVDLVGAAGR